MFGDEVHGYLSAEDFYKPAHSLIFQTAQTLEEKGDPIDIMTVSDLLEKQGKLEQSGGSAYFGGADKLCSFWGEYCFVHPPH